MKFYSYKFCTFENSIDFITVDRYNGDKVGDFNDNK